MSLQIANSILNSVELDLAVAQVMVTARNDGYAHGYAECVAHVSRALDVTWDNTRAETYGVNTAAAHATAKEEYNKLQIHILSLIEGALPEEDFVEKLKDIFAGIEQD